MQEDEGAGALRFFEKVSWKVKAYSVLSTQQSAFRAPLHAAVFLRTRSFWVVYSLLAVVLLGPTIAPSISFRYFLDRNQVR